MNEYPRAIGWRLVVKPVDDANPNIWLPRHVGTTRRGIVVSVGGNVQEITVGDAIIFHTGRATEIRAGNESFYMVEHAEVLCALDDEASVEHEANR